MPKSLNVVFLDRGGSTFVKYIGKTDEYFDALYGTGMWEKDQIKEVVSDVAKKMLEHPDQYIEADAEAEEIQLYASSSVGRVGEIVPKQEDEDSPEQQARDAIAQMGREDLKQFVTTNFRVSLDGRASVASMREQAIRLVDRFGVTG